MINADRTPADIGLTSVASRSIETKAFMENYVPPGVSKITQKSDPAL